MAAGAGGPWKHVSPQVPVYFLGGSTAGLLAAGREELWWSGDLGTSWKAVPRPGQLTQLTAVAVDDTGRVWAGGREGVFVSEDRGGSWQRLRGLDVVDISDLYFDGRSQRVFVANGATGTTAYAVQLPEKRVEFWDTGWNLRLVRPVGDHLIGMTPFDGVVIQPRMVESVERPIR
jgi:hypothetical protein